MADSLDQWRKERERNHADPEWLITQAERLALMAENSRHSPYGREPDLEMWRMFGGEAGMLAERARRILAGEQVPPIYPDRAG